MYLYILALVSFTFVSGTVYLNENFDDGKFSTRWIHSAVKPEEEMGKFHLASGEWSLDDKDLGIKTSQDARHYGISIKLDKPFISKNKDLVIQYLVKHEQKIDCGGSYIKLLKDPVDQKKFGGDSPYAIMFGPDICGNNRKTHAILNYKRRTTENLKEENYEHPTIRCEDDVDAHLYTFILKRDNTYHIKINGEELSSGNIAEKWNLLPEKKIKDPSKSKPKDWIDEAKIPDPEDLKPEGYDDIPRTIPDPGAVQPEDWNEEDDGEWEPPSIDNPEYKGEWEPKMIDNPEYKGEWVHPLIDNPDYYDDEHLYARCDKCTHVGFELWQVKSGTIFDDILITDEIEVAADHEKTVLKKVRALKEIRENKEKEDAKREAEEAAKKDTDAEEKEDEVEEKEDEVEEKNDEENDTEEKNTEEVSDIEEQTDERDEL